MSKIKEPRTRGEWQELISKQEESGKSIASFCREVGVGHKRFYYWRHRIQEPQRGFLEVKVSDGAELAAEDNWCEVVLANGRRLRVPPGYDMSELQRLVLAVEGC